MTKIVRLSVEFKTLILIYKYILTRGHKKIQNVFSFLPLYYTCELIYMAERISNFYKTRLLPNAYNPHYSYFKNQTSQPRPNLFKKKKSTWAYWLRSRIYMSSKSFVTQRSSVYLLRGLSELIEIRKIN